MFQPTDVSGCWFWLKGDEAQLFPLNPSLPDRYVSSINNAGYQPCTFSSDGSIIDAIFNPDTLNSHATIKFVSTRGLGTGAIQNIPKTENVTAIYLYKQNNASVGASVQYLFQGPADVNSNSINVFSSTLQLSNSILFSFYLNGNYSSLSSASGYLNDWIIRSDIADDSMVTFRRNGFPIASGAVVSLPLPDISIPPFNGEGECIFGGSVGVAQQEIAEAIIYDRRIADEDITKVENYLKFKYFVGGVAGSPTFIHGSNADTSGQFHPLTPLYIDALPSSGEIPLFIAQAYTVSSGMPLYTVGVPIHSSETELFIGSSDPILSSGTLYTLGGETASPSGISLYIGSAESFNSNVFLYTIAAPNSSGSTDLFIHGRTLSDGNQPLYIRGLQNLSANNNTALFIAANTSSSNPAVSGFYSGCEFYTYGGGSPGTNLNLYMNADLQGSNNAGMPLFIDNHAPTALNTTDMFIQNNNLAFSGQAKMFVKGLGDLDGGLTNQGNMNLYIERWPAGMATLFMNSATVPSSTPLYISSANSFSASVTMMMSGGQQLMGTGSFPIYVDAGFVRNDNISVYTHGLPSSNNNSTLYTNGF